MKDYEKVRDDPNSLLQTSSSGPPNNQFFQYYKEIIIDHNQVSGTGSHKNFPVLISLLDSDLHDDVQSNGNDIAFANDTAWLDHEIELFDQAYNITHAQLIAWIRIPNLSTSVDTTIRMYYGNTTMTSRENPAEVWVNNYAGVWHLDESSGGSDAIKDSTFNSNHGTDFSNPNLGEDGKVHKSVEFTRGTDQRIEIQDDPTLDTTDQLTFEAWINPDINNEWMTIASKMGGSWNSYNFHVFDTLYFAMDDMGHLYVALESSTGSDEEWDTNVGISINTWQHIVFTYNSSDSIGKIYKNGNYITQHNFYLGTLKSNNNPFYLGLSRAFTNDELFDGNMDEVRHSNVTRSGEWIATEFNNQYNPQSFYSIGEECSISSHPPNAHYFKYYKEIIIDHTKVSGSNDILNFPVLISILDTDLHDDVQLDGDDIAFSYGIDWLDHEIEIFNQTYDETHAQLVAWVRVPILYHDKDTIIHLYYGNSTMGSRENSGGVWDDNYKGVWHLSETSGTHYDSTSNENDGTANGGLNQNITGKIDGADDFNGANANIAISDSPNLDITDAITIQVWITDNAIARRRIVTKGGEIYVLRTDYSGTLHAYLMKGSTLYYARSQNNLITTGKYYYVALTWDGVSGDHYLRLFCDGSEISSYDTQDSVISPLDTSNDSLFIGSHATGEWWDGRIDEVRISDIARSGDWIATEYNNQDDPSSFYSIGKEYTISGIPPNEKYFKYYKEVIINHSMISGSHDLYNFPLLISIIDDDLHDKAQMDGDDIAFSYNGAWLDHEIELYNQTYSSSQAQLVAWVSIPRLSPSLNTSIRMYYGNSTMGPQENPEAVWSNSYLGVWHLSESSGSAEDSTSYGINGIPSGDVTQGILGQIGNSYYFDRDGLGTVNMGDPLDGHLDFMDNEDFTIEFWVNLDYFYYYSPFLVSKRTGSSSSSQGYSVQVFDDNKGIASYEISSDGPVFGVDGTTSLLDTGWHHVVYIFNEDNATSSTIYIDGVDDKSSSYGTISSIDNFNNNANFRLNGQSTPYTDNMMDGKMDEVRISNVVYSEDWIQTEYNNQKDPTSFYTVGTEVTFDITPPTYSNLIESSDPLELGATEVIQINVSDPSGINNVQIEFSSSNHSMTNIGGDTWQYDWTPSTVGNYTYTIWMEDNYNNWNSTFGAIEVIDTTPPTYSDLIESADPLQIGQNETLTIKVYDSPGSGVNQVLLEYGLVPTNHSMVQDGNTWSWSKWKPALGLHSYTIWMEDNCNNWNSTSGTITVEESYAPIIENLTKSEDPLELGNNITISVDVYDNESSVDAVLIELDGENHTMSIVSGSTYEFTWTRSYIGIVYYTIYANDTENNWNSLSSSFNIVDTTPPTFFDLEKSEDPLEFGNTVTISVNLTDLSDINQVKIEVENLNHSMTDLGGNKWQYDLWTPSTTGDFSYKIWAEDNNNNWGNISDSILVRDTILPIYSGLTESANTVELGDFLIISINSTDLAGIKDVKIEYKNSNYSMINIGGDIWQYNSWMDGWTSIGNYSYTIYITDNNNNLNYVSSSILFQDTIIPIYSNLFENADPLELGDNSLIRIDIYDIAGINQTLIEFEGENHTMTNIYGDTWQYDSWTPNDWIIYQYRIYMEDNSGNWNNFITNITVQDTIPPTPPVFSNSPSGAISGIIVFDWLDGSDPSGISYYILIIDNEEDPFATPGYVYIFNITNTGPESSYCILPQNISLGNYFYFLAQIDGVGQQSSYTIGAFTVIKDNNGSPWNNPFLIIGIILVSVLGSLTAIVLVRRKLKKNVIPTLEKIPFKIISSHINRLSSVNFTVQADKIQDITDEKEQETNIDEIKSFGEQLFAEGAYLEAQKQFKLGRDLLINLGREEEAKLFSELISGIEGLIEERENRIENLERVKNEGEAVKIYETFYDVIKISKKLRDPDTASFYQSELIQFFQINRSKWVDLEEYRSNLEAKADSLLNNYQFENAAQLYGKCEKISQLFVQLEKDGEIANIEKFKNKKAECLDRIT